MIGIEMKKKKYRPWKHDHRHKCCKCSSSYHLHRHHITYQPPITEFLCVKHHKQITALNTAAAPVAHTNLKTKTTYTNQIRVILWRWFLSSKYTPELVTPVHIRKVLKNSLNLKYRLSHKGNSDNAGKQPTEIRLNAEPVLSRLSTVSSMVYFGMG